MTSHELAAKLLKQPDLPVVISDEGDLNEIRSIELGWDSREAENSADKMIVRLFRIA